MSLMKNALIRIFDRAEKMQLLSSISPLMAMDGVKLEFTQDALRGNR
jgi:ATP-dependent protease Clp ATPase subunit